MHRPTFLHSFSKKWSHCLAFRLQLWVLLAGLPSLALGVILAGLLYHTVIISAERSAALSARQVMDTMDRIVFDRLGDAELFASLPVVRSLDRRHLQRVANLCVLTYAPYYAFAAIADLKGNLLAVNNIDLLGHTIETKHLIGISVQEQRWFQEALTHHEKVVVSDSPSDFLLKTYGHPPGGMIVLARAVKGYSGEVVGVWSAHLTVDSLRQVLQHINAGSDQTTYPMVLKTEMGEPLLRIGVPPSNAPIAVVASSGFSRWPGNQWALEVYLPPDLRYQQRMFIGLAGLVVLLLTTAGTVGIAHIFRQELVKPLAHLESQVMLIEAQPHRPPRAIPALSNRDHGGAFRESLLQREDEFGRIARLLLAQTADMQGYMNQLTLLNESHQSIQEHVVFLPTLFERILHTAKTVTNARYAALAVLDETGERFVQFLTEGMDEETKRAIGRLPTARGLLGTVLRKEGVVRLADLTRHPESIGFPPHHPQMRSFLGVSIRAHGRLFGRLYLTDKLASDWKEPDSAVTDFTELDEQLIAALAYQAGTAIEIATLIEEIRTTQNRDRALLDSVEEGIYGIDPFGRCLFINRAGSQMLGYAANELIGQPMHGLIHHTRHNGSPFLEADCPMLAAMRAQTGCRLDDELLWRKNGTSFPAICSVTPLRDGTETEAGAVVTFSDLTDRKALEMQVRQGQRMEALGQLAAGVAHDFNNLLTVMKGYSDLALLQTDLSPLGRGRIEEIKKATDRAALLTGQLLAFARKQSIERQIVNIDDIIVGLESLVRRLIGAGILLHIELTPDQKWVRIDVGGIEQVLINLIVNARDAMPQGGRLDVRTAVLDRDATAEHLPMNTDFGPSVMISVTDTGIGMDETTKARMFEPFFTTKSPGRGTGLGLATAHRIVTQNEGMIAVASEPGLGTTITLFLPLVEPPQTWTASDGTHAPVRGGDETILLVEDDPTVQSLVKTVLASQGYHLLTASDGREGRQVAKQFEGAIHLLVTDAMMPYLNGVAMAKQLRARRPHLKVLFITGATDAELVRYGSLSMHGEVLPKPFANETLLQAVRRVLDQPMGQLSLPNTAGEPERILVIDDDDQVNSMLQEMLTSEQYHVLAASSGQDAIELLRKGPVDLVITDMLMPNMDGVEVIQEIRRQWPSLRIIGMSGGGIGATPEFYLSLARQLGAVTTLIKPFSREQLLQAVREMME